MTADQGQYEKFMAKLSKSGLELQKDFSRLSPENQKRFMQEVNQRLKCFGHAVTIYRYSTESISWDELLPSAQDKIINNSVNCRTKSVK